jgi:hypothetical protein
VLKKPGSHSSPKPNNRKSNIQLTTSSVDIPVI